MTPLYTTDGPTSSENGPSTPKKLMVEEVQVGGALAEPVEHWKAPEIVETTLKYPVLTFRKTFNTNKKRGFLQQLKEVIHNMRPVIEGQTRGSAEAVKWYIDAKLNMNFCKSTSPGIKTDPTVTLRPELFKSINTHELDYQFHVGYNETVLQTDECQRRDSGWVIDHLQHLDQGTCLL